MNFFKLCILIFTLSVSPFTYSETTISDDILNLKLSLHFLYADSYSYSSDSGTLIPSFEKEYIAINDLLDSILEVDGDKSDLLAEAIILWRDFQIEHAKHFTSKDPNGSLSSMSEKKSLIISMLADYADSINESPGMHKSIAYKQSVNISKIVETYSKSAASVNGFVIGENDLSSLCKELDTKILYIESLAETSEDKAILRKVKSQWSFISPSITNLNSSKSVPFIVSRYGKSISRGLMSLKLDSVR